MPGVAHLPLWGWGDDLGHRVIVDTPWNKGGTQLGGHGDETNRLGLRATAIISVAVFFRPAQKKIPCPTLLYRGRGGKGGQGVEVFLVKVGFAA